MLEYTSRQITQLVRQYEMFLKSLSITTSDSDREKIYVQMNRIQERILSETNSIYEEEYMLLLGSNTYLINEERERLSKLITLIEDRIEYVNNTRQKHKELTGFNVDYPKILGEDKLGEYKNSIRIIDKFNENKKNETILSNEINELDPKISEAVKKIKNNRELNTSLEKKMITLLTKVFDKLELYSLTDEKEEIERDFEELEYSLNKAKENVKKSKLSNREELKLECDSLLSSITLEYEKVKEKKYTLRLMEIYDNVITDYEQLLNKREEMYNILNEISSSKLYSIVGEELNKQYNTIKIEKQDMSTYETLVSEREKKYSELQEILEENDSQEFKDVLDELLLNEKKRQEEFLKEQRKREYDERQKRLIEEKKLEDERRKRQQLINEERKKEQGDLTQKLIEEQNNTVIKPQETVDNNEKNKVSFSSVLENDAIPIIQKQGLSNEKIGSEQVINPQETQDNNSIFLDSNIFPVVESEKE